LTLLPVDKYHRNHSCSGVNREPEKSSCRLVVFLTGSLFWDNLNLSQAIGTEIVQAANICIHLPDAGARPDEIQQHPAEGHLPGDVCQDHGQHESAQVDAQDDLGFAYHRGNYIKDRPFLKAVFDIILAQL
jgi:hypothetical protein